MEFAINTFYFIWRLPINTLLLVIGRNNSIRSYKNNNNIIVIIILEVIYESFYFGWGLGVNLILAMDPYGAIRLLIASNQLFLILICINHINRNEKKKILDFCDWEPKPRY